MTWNSRPPFAAGSLTRPSFTVPDLACDTHAHVFGPPERYPAVAEARYTHPPKTEAADYRDALRRLRLRRGVLVQPSYYRFDNRCMLDALDSDPVNLRGVAMIDPAAPLPDLDDWHRRGVRGLRMDFFLAQAQGRSAAEMLAGVQKTSDIAASRGWSIDLYSPGTMVAALGEQLAALPVQVSIAHMGYFHPGTDEERLFQQFAARLAVSSNLWVKLTGSYRLAGPEGQQGVDMMAKMLAVVRPDRLLWGSDWPHVLADPVDTGVLLERLAGWCPDEATRRRILVDHPAHLYWS
jgi:2-pyrone-4,6-dicarboxylate lactonase